MKAQSGKEDTTLLSMVDRRVKQVNVSTTMIWNKTPDSKVSKGERTHGGSKDPISQKKKILERDTVRSDGDNTPNLKLHPDWKSTFVKHLVRASW